MPAPASPKNGYSKARLSRYRTTNNAGVPYEISLCPELYTLRLYKYLFDRHPAGMNYDYITKRNPKRLNSG